MFMIVMHHSMVHGVFTASKTAVVQSSPLSLSLFHTIAYGGRVGVYIFVLITGYFMIYSHISLKKVVKLWLPIFFWSVILTAVVGEGLHKLTAVSLLQSLFPVIFNQYWFMTTYMFIYLLIPVLNKTVLSLNNKLELLLVAMTIVMIVPGAHLYGGNVDSQFVELTIVYLYGALIRKHDLLSNSLFKRLGASLLWLGIVADLGASFGGSYLYHLSQKLFFLKIAGLADHGIYIFSVLTAVGMFSWIGSKKISYNKFINNVAATTFGIYLIHDNASVRSLIWDNLFHMKHLISQPAYIVLYVLALCVAVFIVCSLLEFMRRSVFNKLENRLAIKLDKDATKQLAKITRRLQE